MKNIAASLTKAQFRDRTKGVTRRLGWKNLQPGELLQVCEKCQGLKPGEHLVKICVIRVTEVRQESLNRMISDEAYGRAEAALEGFPEMTGREFACFFTKTHSEGGRQLTFHKPITRIAFEYVDGV